MFGDGVVGVVGVAVGVFPRGVVIVDVCGVIVVVVVAVRRFDGVRACVRSI